MKDRPVTWDLSSFDNETDFAKMVTDIERCEETGESFYVCKESNLLKALTKAYNLGKLRGIITGGVAILTIVGAIGIFLYNSQKNGDG